MFKEVMEEAGSELLTMAIMRIDDFSKALVGIAFCIINMIG